MNNRLFEHAYNVIANTQDVRVDLHLWISGSPAQDQLDCNTIACGGGHLCMDPIMQAEGLSYDLGMHTIVFSRGAFSRDGCITEYGYEALSALLHIPLIAAEDIFCTRGTSKANRRLVEPWALSEHMTDKQLLLSRMRNYLMFKGLRMEGEVLVGHIANE